MTTETNSNSGADVRDILHMIRQDMADDARTFDGKPFDGRTVGEYFGNHGAAIAKLAEIVESLLPPEPAKPTILTGVSGKQYELGESIGTLSGPYSGPCDAKGATVYTDAEGKVTGCTCVVCGRCGKHTGNSNQGHYWGFCQVIRRVERFHFCCPGNCELTAERIGEAS